jgi:hypothetical protein
MKRFTFWQRWLFTVSLLVVGLGVFMAFFNRTAMFTPIDEEVNAVFWGPKLLPPASEKFESWLYGVWGAITIGWGILLAFISHYAYKQREKWAWNCLATGLGCWYLIDTGFSLYHQVFFNALFNTILLALFSLPLLATRRDFTP